LNNSSNRAPVFIVALVLALLVGSAFVLWRYFGENSGRSQRQQAQAVAAAFRDLGKLGVASEANIPESVPPQTFALLLAEKHQLRDLVRSVLNTEPQTASSEQLRKAVVSLLTGAGVAVDDAEQSTTPPQTWGRLSLHLERVLGHKDLVAATIGTSIPCGNDGALYIFEQTGTVWNLALSHEAPGYSKLSDAFGALDYAISPEGANGWYVLTANVAPLCATGWQQIRYSILRKGSDPQRPKSLLSADARLYEGWDQYWKLKADADVAQIEWPSLFKLDGNILIRAHVARYQLTGDAPTRIQPVALYPEDFVDEWAQQPWDKVKDWVASEALADAEPIHKWISSSEFFTTIDFLQSCPIPDHWQLGLTVEATHETRPPMPHVFVDVSKDGDTFRLDRIANDRAPGCPGTDFLPQRPHSLP
jgi:hypothetical protein